jgi:hypothetical protein
MVLRRDNRRDIQLSSSCCSIFLFGIGGLLLILCSFPPSLRTRSGIQSPDSQVLFGRNAVSGLGEAIFFVRYLRPIYVVSPLQILKERIYVHAMHPSF